MIRLFIVFTLAALMMMGPVAAEDFVTARRQMVEQIESMAGPLAVETGIVKFDQRLLSVLAETPRHEFLPKELAGVAYKNRTLSIGHGQTISQPFIVALMTELLHLKDTDKVLEVGTGSGYQTAILAALARQVYTIEIIPDLATAARNVLARLGYANIRTKVGDGYQGWKEFAPFDAIIVTAAPDHVPPALIEQLKPGGRMVIPVGVSSQDLMAIAKRPDGSTTSMTIVPVRFVPFTRE